MSFYSVCTNGQDYSNSSRRAVGGLLLAISSVNDGRADEMTTTNTYSPRNRSTLPISAVQSEVDSTAFFRVIRHLKG